MKHLKNLLPAIVFFLFLTSCSKDKTEDPPMSTDKTLGILQSGNWKITGILYSPAVNGMTDLYAILPPCETDNLFQFKAGGVFYFDQGATKCNMATPQSDAGTWSYNETTKKLMYTSPVLGAYTLTISGITATKFSGFYLQVNSGVNYTVTGTFTLQ